MNPIFVGEEPAVVLGSFRWSTQASSGGSACKTRPLFRGFVFAVVDSAEENAGAHGKLMFEVEFDAGKE